jgi:glycolate oxidase
MGIAEARETIRSCRYCFLCRYACPTFQAIRLESVTPRGYALLLMEVDQGRKDWTPTSIARFYQCTQCGLCRQICEYHWPEDELVRHARQAIVEAGQVPANVDALTAGLLSVRSRSIGLNAAITPSAQSGEKPRLLYFAGCQAMEQRMEIVQANLKLLNAAGIGWEMLEEESCCGAALFELGYTEEARQAAQNLAVRITERQPGILLTGCAHCFRAFIEFYPVWQAGLPAGIQVLHTSQYFHTLMNSGKLQINQNLYGVHVAYHDPCQLGRKMEVYEQPRQLIAAATGTPTLELFHNRELAECCGGGGLMHLTQPEISRHVALVRLQRAVDSGANTLVTACQNCKTSFLNAQNDQSNQIKIMDLSELLSSSLV